MPLDILNKEGTFYFDGVIDENSNFRRLIDQAKENEHVFIDLANIKRINSTGVREWVFTLKELTGQVVYRRCPISIVEQFNMVPEFRGYNSYVESFFASYYCPETDHEKEILIYTAKIDMDDLKAPIITDGHGNRYEFDGDEIEYFHFLQNQNEK